MWRQMALKLGVLVSGRGSNLQAIIDAAESGKLGAEISIVISDNENALALDRARKHAIPALFLDPKGRTKEEFYSLVTQALNEKNVELVVLAGFMRLVPDFFISQFKIINIHPSLLPAFPGLRAQKQALDAGVKEAGCTVHFVTAQVDGGPIILQAKVPVLEGDTEEALSKRILEEEHEILPKAIRLFAEGRIKIENGQVTIDWNGFSD